MREDLQPNVATFRKVKFEDGFNDRAAKELKKRSCSPVSPSNYGLISNRTYFGDDTVGFQSNEKPLVTIRSSGNVQIAEYAAGACESNSTRQWASIRVLSNN